MRRFSVASDQPRVVGPNSPLGPRRRHGNWSDVRDEAGYGGTGGGGMSGEEEGRVGYTRGGTQESEATGIPRAPY